MTFVSGPQDADISVLIVTYNNAGHIGTLLQSLRAENRDTRIRVIVVDNASTDQTEALVSKHLDVKLVQSGGNLGYSAGINTGILHVPTGEHVLILNPDLVVAPGTIKKMVERLAISKAGVVAPRIVDTAGQLFYSLRLEPTLLNGLGEAVLGSHFPQRPILLADTNRRPAAYSEAHPVEWTSGAALLLRSDVVVAIGSWDERFFLYMEETDFLRRVRDSGFDIWFEPDALVIHEQGGSGNSDALAALMAVNRVRYVEKYHGRAFSFIFRSVVALGELLRSGRSSHRHSFMTVIDRSKWAVLPRATFSPDRYASGGSIIVPAHNEASVIGRTLESLGRLLVDDRYQILVICNGCTDETEAIARSKNVDEVLVSGSASKAAALNLGDRIADKWPRLYLDADIEVSPEAVQSVFAALSRGGQDGQPLLEAARPALRYDTVGASRWVRSYFRARSRMPDLDAALWGAGAYAVNRLGHERFKEFPDIVADDLFVDALFPADRKAVVDTDPVTVRVPRDASSLISTLRRGVRAKSEAKGPSSTTGTLRSLVRTIRGPKSAIDASTYAVTAVAARLQVLGRRRHTRQTWERDDSTR